MNNRLPSNSWDIAKFGEKAEEIRNLYQPNKEDERSYIGLEHIAQKSLSLTGLGSSIETVSAKKIFQAGDILFGSLRPYFRKVVLPKFNGVCSTDITVIRGKENTNQIFLFYFIAQQAFIDYATNISSGTRMPRASWKVLCESEWKFPHPITQQKIASILSAYDNLIENNLHRIKILEEMAQNLYREWFVNFRFPGNEKVKMVDSPLGKIPEGWIIENLPNISIVKYGKNLPINKLSKEGDYPVYGAAKIIGYFNSFNRQERTIITGCRGSVGQIQITRPKCFVTNNSFTFDLKNVFDFFWLFYCLKQRGLTDVVGGAAQPQITLEGISTVQIIVPSEKLRKQFNNKTNSIYSLIWNLDEKNRNLIQVRDLLLPKLISGELDVSELDIEIKDAAA